MEQALHHLEPRNLVIDKICQLVKPGGFVVISETNAYNPLNQLFLFHIRGFKTVIKVKENFIGAERILFTFSLKREFEKRNIKTISIRYFRILPNKSIANHFGFIDELIPKFLFPLFTHYNYVGKK